MFWTTLTIHARIFALFFTYHLLCPSYAQHLYNLFIIDFYKHTIWTTIAQCVLVLPALIVLQQLTRFHIFYTDHQCLNSQCSPNSVHKCCQSVQLHWCPYIVLFTSVLMPPLVSILCTVFVFSHCYLALPCRNVSSLLLTFSKVGKKQSRKNGCFSTRLGFKILYLVVSVLQIFTHFLSEKIIPL